MVEVCSGRSSGWVVLAHFFGKFGVSPEAFRNWARKAEIDVGERSGAISGARMEIYRLKKHVGELEGVNEILWAVSVLFA